MSLAASGQIAFTVTPGVRTLEKSASAFRGSGSATTKGARSGALLPSRRVVTATSWPTVQTRPAIRTNMRYPAKIGKPERGAPYSDWPTASFWMRSLGEGADHLDARY